MAQEAEVTKIEQAMEPASEINERINNQTNENGCCAPAQIIAGVEARGAYELTPW